MKKYKDILIPVVIYLTAILLCIGVQVVFKNRQPVKETVYIQASLKYEEPSDFSLKELEKEILKYSPQYPDIILSQAKWESGHFKSVLFKEQNNIFGMRHPGKRLTLSKGVKRGYGVFNSWQESVADRMIFEALYLKGKSRAQYVKYLNMNYSESPDYHLITKKQ